MATSDSSIPLFFAIVSSTIALSYWAYWIYNNIDFLLWNLLYNQYVLNFLRFFKNSKFRQIADIIEYKNSFSKSITDLFDLFFTLDKDHSLEIDWDVDMKALRANRNHIQILNNIVYGYDREQKIKLSMQKQQFWIRYTYCEVVKEKDFIGIWVEIIATKVFERMFKITFLNLFGIKSDELESANDFWNPFELLVLLSEELKKLIIINDKVKFDEEFGKIKDEFIINNLSFVHKNGIWVDGLDDNIVNEIHNLDLESNDFLNKTGPIISFYLNKVNRTSDEYIIFKEKFTKIIISRTIPSLKKVKIINQIN